MTKYYVDIEESLAEKLKRVAEDDIIEVLTKLAEKETSSDELAAYESISEIQQDKSLSSEDRKRLELKAQRRSGFAKR